MADATLKKYHSRKILRFKKNNQKKVLSTLKHSQIHSTSLTNQFTSSHSQRTSQQHSTFTTFNIRNTPRDRLCCCCGKPNLLKPLA